METYVKLTLKGANGHNLTVLFKGKFDQINDMLIKHKLTDYKVIDFKYQSILIIE